MQPNENGNAQAINVEVNLLFDLKRHAPDGPMPFCLRLERNATLGGLLERIGIPPTPDLAALVDGRPSNRSSLLRDNCRVAIFPVVLGG